MEAHIVDISPDTAQLLLFLVVGLEAQREQELKADSAARRFYPYPDTLRIAWNALGYHGMTPEMVSVPHTLSGLLKRCTRPVGEWLSPAFIPTDFPSNAPLLYGGSEIELSDAAAQFLNEQIFTGTAVIKLRDAQQLNRFIENQRFVNLLNQLRSKPWTLALQADYTRLRRFLIENPYTTRVGILKQFSASSLSPSDVGGLYESCSPAQDYYRCDKCGVLDSVSKYRLIGAKPDVCSDHAINAPHIHRVEQAEGLCRLYPGIHARVALHGIAEIGIFNRLHILREKYPKRIQAIEEWPNIDSYDLRVVFADGVTWAVDIKDFSDPHRLSDELKPMRGREEHTRFDRGFYVIPKRRVLNNPRYLEDARAGAEQLPVDYALCDDETFIALVAEYRP